VLLVRIPLGPSPWLRRLRCGSLRIVRRLTAHAEIQKISERFAAIEQVFSGRYDYLLEASGFSLGEENELTVLTEWVKRRQRLDEAYKASQTHLKF
jgi:hypothetical protein